VIRPIAPLDELVQLVQQIPYIGIKHVHKLVDHFLNLDEKRLEQLIEKLKKIRARLILCERCFFFCDRDTKCQFCFDQSRNTKLICVLEKWQDVIAIEKTNAYDGLYHVLGGALSPIEGITQDKLTIDKLIERVAQEQVTEVILGTNQTPEGEATAMCIDRRLKGKSVLVSCFARGLPVGALVGASDRLTVYKALTQRRPF
jgi:recombination protein RecR